MPAISSRLYAIPVTVLLSTSLQADPYQFEIAADYSKLDEDTSEHKTGTLSAQYFTTPVKTYSTPLAEAAFLGRNSAIGAAYITSEASFEGSTLTDTDEDGGLFGFTYVSERDGYIIGFAYAKTSYTTNLSHIDGDQTVAMYNFGKYIDNDSALYLTYSDAETTASNSITSQSVESDDTAYSINYKTVQELRGSTAYNLEASAGIEKSEFLGTKEDNRVFELDADYYSSYMSSIGAGIEINRGDNVSSEGNTYQIRTQHFFTSQFAVSLAYEKFIADDDTVTEDSKTIEVGLTARF